MRGEGGSFWDEVAFFTLLYPFHSQTWYVRTTSLVENSVTLFLFVRALQGWTKGSRKSENVVIPISVPVPEKIGFL